MYRIGVDVGGTFTDLVLRDGSGNEWIRKILSTPEDPANGVIEGLQLFAAAEGKTLGNFLGQVDRIVHGTTVTTNAVLTGRTARTGLLTTYGFRDALEMRRGIRESRYDNKYLAPRPLVPRWLRRPVRGRIDWSGREIDPLVLDDVTNAAILFRNNQIEAVAVCFMHAHANDTHEREAAALLKNLLPDIFVTSSAEILPQVRFYERVSTTVLNAAVGPILKGYLDRLANSLRNSGFTGRLLIMQSNGGVSTPETVVCRAACTLLSGPAATPIATRSLKRPEGITGLITMDMGGTSFETSLAKDAISQITSSSTINRFVTALPALDIKTIGAGGGSIARVDEGGILRVGPESAGARPGPACYGFGGTDATCSDANLLLGYLSADFFAGGSIRLDVARARRAVMRHVGDPLGCSLTEAAAGIHRITNVRMATAIREVSIERGLDPRDFALLCAGGAGGIHAAGIARELHMTAVVVPRRASVFCAVGMLYTDLRHDFVRSCTIPLTDTTVGSGQLEDLVRGMETEGHSLLEEEGVPEQDRRFAVSLDLRYSGQYHEVRVENVPGAAVRKGHIGIISELFHQRHDHLYGYTLEEEGTPIELINILLAATGLTDKPAIDETPDAGPNADHACKGYRPAFQGTSNEFASCPVYDGDQLQHGNRFSGPALVETNTMTIVVPDGFDVFVDAIGTIIMKDQGQDH